MTTSVAEIIREFELALAQSNLIKASENLLVINQRWDELDEDDQQRMIDLQSLYVTLALAANQASPDARQ